MVPGSWVLVQGVWDTGRTLHQPKVVRDLHGVRIRHLLLLPHLHALLRPLLGQLHRHAARLLLLARPAGGEGPRPVETWRGRVEEGEQRAPARLGHRRVESCCWHAARSRKSDGDLLQSRDLFLVIASPCRGAVKPFTRIGSACCRFGCVRLYQHHPPPPHRRPLDVEESRRPSARRQLRRPVWRTTPHPALAESGEAASSCVR